MSFDRSQLLSGLNRKGAFLYKNGKMINLFDDDLEQIINDQVDTERFTLQLGCGSCCKKVSNAEMFFYIGFFGEDFDFAQFAIPAEGECLLVETFCNGKLVEKQIASLFGIQVNPDRVLPTESINAKILTNQLTNHKGSLCSKHLLNRVKNCISARNNGINQEFPFLLEAILNMCEDQKLTVQFTCGDCIKKATNIECFAYNFGFVEFLPTEGECIVEKTFCGGKLVDTDVFTRTGIYFANICSIECGAVEIC